MSGIKFTPSPTKSPSFCTIGTMAEYTWYKNAQGDECYWYKNGDNVIRVNKPDNIFICSSPSEDWDKNWKLEQVPPGELVFTFQVK